MCPGVASKRIIAASLTKLVHSKVICGGTLTEWDSREHKKKKNENAKMIYLLVALDCCLRESRIQIESDKSVVLEYHAQASADHDDY